MFEKLKRKLLLKKVSKMTLKWTILSNGDLQITKKNGMSFVFGKDSKLKGFSYIENIRHIEPLKRIN